MPSPPSPPPSPPLTLPPPSPPPSPPLTLPPPSPPSPPQSFLPQLPSPTLPEPEPLVSEAGNESDNSGESSKVKKQKLDEEDSESDSSVDEFYRPLIPGEKLDRAGWKRFFEQVHESEGFDFEDHPGVDGGPSGLVFRLPHYITNPENLERMKCYAAQALEQYNNKNDTKYEVNEILKVNAQVISSFMFFITLSVKNGENEYFQVKVVQRRNGFFDFPIVRPRVKGGLDI